MGVRPTQKIKPAMMVEVVSGPFLFTLSLKTWSSLRAVGLRAGSWARSEKIGCAVIQHSGMMEYWSVGIMGLAEWDLFLWKWHGTEFKI
jgi:hypothetical protein